MWTTIDCGGQACEVFEPARSRLGAVIYLHDAEQRSLRDRQPFVESFERFGLSVVAPQAGPIWWTDRDCPTFDARQSAQEFVCKDVVQLIAERWCIRPPAIGLLGFEMGGQGALRMAYRFPNLFPTVAAIAPAVDYQSCYVDGDEVLLGMYADAESVRQDTATLHVHPLNWPRHQYFCCDPADPDWFESADRLHMKLASIGIPHQFDLETSVGESGFDYALKMASTAIQFLAESLDFERKRLPVRQ